MNAESLAPFQAAFLDRFRAEESASCHMLVAPPGFGKTFLAIHIASAMLKESASARVLMLAPNSMMAEHFAQKIQEGGADAISVDKRRFRELAASAPKGGALWPSGRVIVISVDIAKQEDVAQAIIETSWDLIIWDEAHRIVGLRKQLLELLLRIGVASRLLLLTATPDGLSIDGLDVTTWERNGIAPAVQKSLCTVEYERHPDEVVALTALTDFILCLPETAEGRLLAGSLQDSASSSYSALENLIFLIGSAERFREIRNFLSNGQMSEETQSNAPSIETVVVWSKVLESLDAISVDSKLEALKSILLQQIAYSDQVSRRVCILTAFKDTASYIQSALRDFDVSIECIHEGTTLEGRYRAESHFLGGDVVLILTDAAAQDLELREADFLIHYDLPREDLQFEMRVGQFDTVSRTKPLAMCVLHDILNSWKPETESQMRLGFLAGSRS
jgi:superfamily II DNA or RNA helicase